ncbi:hypothetical protein NKH77_25305 [Streptomyces sp. M19]
MSRRRSRPSRLKALLVTTVATATTLALPPAAAPAFAAYGAPTTRLPARPRASPARPTTRGPSTTPPST